MPNGRWTTFHSPNEIDVLEEPSQSLSREVVVELVDVEFPPQSPFVGTRCQWWRIPHRKVASPARVQLQEGLAAGLIMILGCSPPEMGITPNPKNLMVKTRIITLIIPDIPFNRRALDLIYRGSDMLDPSASMWELVTTSKIPSSLRRLAQLGMNSMKSWPPMEASVIPRSRPSRHRKSATTIHLHRPHGDGDIALHRPREFAFSRLALVLSGAFPSTVAPG